MITLKSVSNSTSSCRNTSLEEVRTGDFSSTWIRIWLGVKDSYYRPSRGLWNSLNRY